MPDAFPARWATLLKTRKRDGTWVETPVNLAVDGDRGWFSTPATTGKVKRLRYTADVEIAPCTPRGRPTGRAFTGRARLLEGARPSAPTACWPPGTASCSALWCRSSSGSSGRTRGTTRSPACARWRRPNRPDRLALRPNEHEHMFV